MFNMREYHRKWWKRNKKRLRARRKQWRRTHREEIGVIKKRYYRTELGHYGILKENAAKHRRSVKISFSYYRKLVSSPCFYCGGKLPVSGAGVDRINSNRGYVKGNLRPCCTQCNIAKNNWTEKEFKAWVLAIYLHWIRK